MRIRVLIIVLLMLPAALRSQSLEVRSQPDGVVREFVRFADIFGSRLVTAFDSIPADKYGYRPTPAQQTIGYIAQHLEDANYGLCERLGGPKHPRTTKDSLADTIKARWPKDTLVARLEASLRYCDDAMERLDAVPSAALASTLLAVETDLAEHYSQVAVYMRLLGLVPPSALPPTPRTAIEVPASSLPTYVGVYQLATGVEIDITLRDGVLFVRPAGAPAAVRLWPDNRDSFFVKEVDAQITFTRSPNNSVTGLILHQYGRHRTARKVR